MMYVPVLSALKCDFCAIAMSMLRACEKGEVSERSRSARENELRQGGRT